MLGVSLNKTFPSFLIPHIFILIIYRLFTYMSVFYLILKLCKQARLNKAVHHDNYVESVKKINIYFIYPIL